jgi:hypothetical protein
MRAKEFITESAETIETYLALMGFSYTKLEQQSSLVKQYYDAHKISHEKMKSYLIDINIAIHSVTDDPNVWNKFSDDPEVSVIYNKIATLANSNYEYLERNTA